MSLAPRDRLQQIIAVGVELGVVRGIKEHVRHLLAIDNIDDFHRACTELEPAVNATKKSQARSLFGR